MGKCEVIPRKEVAFFSPPEAFYDVKICKKNAFAVGTVPRTPLGEGGSRRCPIPCWGGKHPHTSPNSPFSAFRYSRLRRSLLVAVVESKKSLNYTIVTTCTRSVAPYSGGTESVPPEWGARSDD